jgi:hypothetical protein
MFLRTVSGFRKRIRNFGLLFHLYNKGRFRERADPEPGRLTGVERVAYDLPRSSAGFARLHERKWEI